MRTKTLLIAAAALAATVISSQAQVYSGVVGYVNVTAPSGKFVFLNNPLTTGNDVISNVVQNVPGGTTVNIWNGSGFDVLQYTALSHTWKQGTTATNTYPLPPGKGFFLTASANTNVTFVGSTLISPGSDESITNGLSTSLNAVGALVPISDVVTNAATFGLLVAGGSTLQQWSVPNQTFSVFQYSSLSHVWKQGTTVTNPVIGVAEGFFIQPASATNWVITLP
jgi:hypothetical protein